MRLPHALLGLSALCLVAAAMPLLASHHSSPDSKVLLAAVAAPTRTPANVLRDKYRHPAATLAFFGVTPTQTVVEYSPGGGGWYTEILTPLLRDHGALYAAQAPGKSFDTLRAKLDADPATYGTVKLVPWPDTAIPAGSVDTLLTFRNVHNMVIGGTEAATFKAFYALLRPGGTLGIVDHRLPEKRDSAAEKDSGYLKVSTVRRIAQAAGFRLVASSEINANPKDSADWPDGVWTLPPVLTNGETNRAKYLAIGESDRMTLRFVKPTK